MPYSLRSTNLQQNAAGCGKGKQRRKYFCQPDPNAFCGSLQHFCRIADEGIQQEKDKETAYNGTFFQNITPNRKAENLPFSIWEDFRLYVFYRMTRGFVKS